MQKRAKKISVAVGKSLIIIGLVWLIGIAGGDDFQTLFGEIEFSETLAEIKKVMMFFAAGSALIYAGKHNFKKRGRKNEQIH